MSEGLIHVKREGFDPTRPLRIPYQGPWELFGGENTVMTVAQSVMVISKFVQVTYARPGHILVGLSA